MKIRGSPIRISEEFKDFIDNTRATRRSKATGIDKEMLTQLQTCDLVVKYFKLNNDKFLELIKIKFEKENDNR